MLIEVTIPGELRGKQRPRATRQGRIYTPSETRNAEAFIRLLAAEAMGDHGPLEEPLMMTLSIGVGIPKSFSKKQRAAALEGALVPAKKPDLDNAIKLVADAMNGIVFLDDKQITMLIAEKRYADKPETKVIVGPRATPMTSPAAVPPT